MHELEVDLDSGVVLVTFDGFAFSEDDGELDLIDVVMVESCSDAEEGPYRPTLPERIHIETRCWEYLLSERKDRMEMANELFSD